MRDIIPIKSCQLACKIDFWKIHISEKRKDVTGPSYDGDLITSFSSVGTRYKRSLAPTICEDMQAANLSTLASTSSGTSAPILYPICYMSLDPLLSFGSPHGYNKLVFSFTL